MNYALSEKPPRADTADGPVQFFAVPAHAVKNAEDQRDMWLWFGDSLVDCREGVFEVGDDGRLEFVPNND